MANEVFISYSRRDYQKVRKIKDTIDREVGIDCWMDLDGIESDDLFVEVIIDAINRHDTILFMMSKDSMVSKWALKELSFAESKNKRIVLVRIDSAPLPDKFIFNYEYKQQISWDNELQRNKLIKNLCHWFPPKPPVPDPKPPVPDPKPPIKRIKLKWILIFLPILVISFIYIWLLDDKPVSEDSMLEDSVVYISPNDTFPDSYYHKVQNVNGLWGFCSPEKKILIECKWKSVGIFSEGLAPVRNNSNNMCGYIDRWGKLIIGYQFCNAGNFSEGLAKIMNSESKWGYINQEGEEVIPCNILVEPSDFKNGTAVYKDDSIKYTINKNGLKIKKEAVDKAPDLSAD